MIKYNKKAIKEILIISFVCILMMTIAIYYRTTRQIRISENPKYIFGRVIKKYYTMKSGDKVLCEYYVSGKKYTLTSTYLRNKQSIFIGDSVQIVYEENDPDNSYIVEDSCHRLKTKANLYPIRFNPNTQNDFKLLRKSLNPNNTIKHISK